MMNTLRGLSAAAFAPVNRLALCILAIFTGVQLSFEHEPGSHRVFLARLLISVGFLFAFAFGIGQGGFDVPFRQFMVMPELSIPLVTATTLACFFGALLVTGYNFESQAKAFGTALCAAGAAGLFTFAVLVSQVSRTDPWTLLLAEPVSGLSRPFRESGTLLGVVLLLAAVERAVVFAGMRRQERSYRKRF